MPFYNKKLGNVGVELEFPLLNMSKKPVDAHIAVGLLDYFCENGFFTDETSLDGENAFITNNDGDTLSFDNSYNNLEFAMSFGDSLCNISDRFYKLHEAAAAYLQKHNYLVAGMGINPYKAYTNQAHVDYPIYNFVDSFLHKYPARHSFPDFPAYLSSVQTHLDISAQALPFATSLFARLDFVRAALFSNSVSWNEDKILCYRDYLWEGSAFPNVGKVDDVYNSIDDIIESFLNRKIFCCIRDGKYKDFAPVLVRDYFSGQNDEDINQLLSFKSIEITARGTLEIRSDCAQPINDAFAPPAFSLGILYNMESANEFLNGFNFTDKTSKLRGDVISGGLVLPTTLTLGLVEIAEQGLKKRGKGEERLLKPLFERAEKSLCPARQTLVRLAKNETIESIIMDYS